MFDADQTAQRVHAELEQVFAPVPSPAAVGRERPASRARKRRLSPQAIGTVAAAVLAGIAVGSLLPRSPARPAPPASVSVDAPSTGQQLQVLLTEPRPTPVISGARLETLPEPPAIDSPLRANPGPLLPAVGARPVARSPEATPAIARTPVGPVSEPSCRIGDDDCLDLDADLTEADRALAETYREARAVGAPASALRTLREDWRVLRDETPGSSRADRLNAYRAQIGAARELIDETRGEQAEDEPRPPRVDRQ